MGFHPDNCLCNGWIDQGSSHDVCDARHITAIARKHLKRPMQRLLVFGGTKIHRLIYLDGLQAWISRMGRSEIILLLLLTRFCHLDIQKNSVRHPNIINSTKTQHTLNCTPLHLIFTLPKHLIFIQSSSNPPIFRLKKTFPPFLPSPVHDHSSSSGRWWQPLWCYWLIVGPDNESCWQYRLRSTKK